MNDMIQSMTGLLGAFACIVWLGKSVFSGVKRGDMRDVTTWEEDE